MHFVIISLMFSLKDIKLLAQTFLVKIGIKCIISNSSYYLPPLFLHGLIWYGNGFIPSSYTQLTHNRPWHLPPHFSMTAEIPTHVQTLLQSFRISGWKITQCSIFCLFCCEWQKMSVYHKYGHHQLLSPKCCNRIWDLRSTKLSLKNSQFCIVNKKPWASAGKSNRFASGWKFSSCKISPRTNSVGMNKRLKDTNFPMQVNNLSLAFHQLCCC